MARVTGKSGILNKVSEEVQDIASQPPHEGEMTRKIEQQTAKIPSISFLGLAVGSMVASAALAFFARRKDLANFVGLWAPSLLLIGVYNKLVKLESEGLGQRNGHRQAAGRTGEEVTGESHAQSYGGASQTFGSQGASAPVVTGQGYSGV